MSSPSLTIAWGLAGLLLFNSPIFSAARAAETPSAASSSDAFLDSASVSWKVNDFAIARWKTLVGGIEGGQLPQEDVQFGLWELAPHAIYHGHRHEVPEIYYILEGSGEWTVGEETRVVGPGMTIYTQPGAVHKMVNRSDMPLRTLWFWWAPAGQRDVFTGDYEFTEESPTQPDKVVPWSVESDPNMEKLHAGEQ